MKIREIYGIIRNKKGSSFPLVVFVALVLAMILCGVSIKYNIFRKFIEVQ